MTVAVNEWNEEMKSTRIKDDSSVNPYIADTVIKEAK